jgi:hypothetical protein
MATKKTATRRKTAPATFTPQTMGEGAVRDLVKQELRTAFQNQSRELEKHLNSIHDRLVALETR